MKNYYFLLFFLFIRVFSSAQEAPSLNDLKRCLEGEMMVIASQDEDCVNSDWPFYIFNTSNGEYFDWVNSYHIVEKFEENGFLVELIRYNEPIENKNPKYYKRAILNLKTGKYLVPFDEQYIEYINEEQLFIVNQKGNGFLVNIEGEIITQNKYQNIGYISNFGFFDKDLFDYGENIFDKNENIVAKFPKHIIVDAIDAQNYIAIPLDVDMEPKVDHFQIIDKNQKVLFEDECGYLFLDKDKYVLGHGLCDTDDSYSILIRNKKGKWINPLKKCLKNIT